MSTDTGTTDAQQPDPADETDDVEQQPDDTSEQQPDDEDNQPEGKTAREAQRLRARAREAETERDALRGRLDALDRGEVERLAGAVLGHGADLLLVTDLAALRGEDGAIDPDKVAEAAEASATARPHWRRGGGDGVRRQPARERPEGFGFTPSHGLDRGNSGGADWRRVITPRGKRVTE